MAGFEELGVNAEDARVAAEIALVGVVLYFGLGRDRWMNRYERARKLEQKTGLLTYPAFLEEVAKRTSSTSRARDVGRTHGLVLADIDDFKRWNTRLSHTVVDKKALMPVVETIRPESDLVCRFGGEEFILFLGDTDEKGIDTVCRRIQQNVNAIKPDSASVDSVNMTMAYTTFEQGGDFEAAIQELSTRVIEAKEIPGKNQIVGLNAMQT